MLRALNAIAPAPLEESELQALGLSLGSDVPFFATGLVAAVAQGRGESLSDARVTLPPADVLLVVPSVSIATAEAYRWLRESGRYHQTAARADAASPSSWSAMDHGNTFEPVVEGKYPDLRRYRERLSDAGATIARLSGSGSTVFGLFEAGAPRERELGIDALVIRTRTAKNVVQVEARE